MTSACSRWSQPPKAAISNWNGSTVEVYAMPPIHFGTLRVQHHDPYRGLRRRSRRRPRGIRITVRRPSIGES